ncbi:hypothetical protein SAMD00023353_2400090 [Rosellinia necatrix]|uniref:Uncharacterized protein n=1 Tax=Rosellinia necatrix TaxID=77044 RepID=A0A1W2TFM1_ROSNE|nr:hypothetical protein SAMD00023353_2400090 [Rosellinia necatrix]
MDPLDSVISNVPDWLKRLEELTGQIEQRQRDLAKFSGARPPSASGKSLRNRGSTESLKPQDEGAAFPSPMPDPTTDQAPKPIITNIPPQTPDGQRRPNGPQPPSTPASDPWTGSSLIRHTNELVATAQRRARATVRKRQKTDSMISAEGTPKYRTRRMVLVYYDSYVQSFFEELVKFVSAQRNLMRKAKMAAKVAHIRRLAELEMPEEEDDDESGELKPGNELVAANPASPAPNPRQDGTEAIRSQYLSTRPYGSVLRNPAYNLMPGRGMRTSALNGGLGFFNEKGDIWDELDKGLEYVQGLCERAAHQFLRDGDCNEEIEKIKARLVKVKESAISEKERVSAEQTKTETQSEPKPTVLSGPNHTSAPKPLDDTVIPESGPEPDRDFTLGSKPELLPEPGPPRILRPPTVRRDNFGKTPVPELIPGIDEGIEMVDDFKPMYRSTRMMRRPV